MARDGDRERGVWQVQEQQQQNDELIKYQRRKRISKAITRTLRYDFQDGAYLREDVIYDKLRFRWLNYQEFKNTLTMYEDRYLTDVTWEANQYFTWYKLKPSRDRRHRHGLVPRARPDWKGDNGDDTSS